ncbi:MAG: sigma 54-interacting transcriptional regulator [Candidatus Brocadiae bacterium]|nr:sigma 54-interacting transcriptional regulator [Candidatus Brocadiia bacterium]
MQKNETSETMSALYLQGKVKFETLKQGTKSPAMKEILEQARKFSKSSDPILLIGETGTGKNMIAQAIHNERQLEGDPTEINCTGIPEQLWESELFGHKKGAFTNAYENKVGLAKIATNGTLFFDEIGELPLYTQAKLLRFIEQKRFYAIGSTEEQETNAHIVCATNKSLKELLDPQKFRTDLFYRLSLFIRIPSLRERKEDLDFLIGKFLDDVKEKTRKELAISEDVIEFFQKYSWPGNIRQLKHAIRYAVYSVSEGDTIKLNHLPPWLIETQVEEIKTQAEEVCEEENFSLDTAVRKHILKVLDITNGNVAKAARMLGKSEETIRQKRDQYKEQGLL